MSRKIKPVYVLVVLWTLVLLLAGKTRAEKAIDAGKAEDFKGKTFDLKEKGEAVFLLTCPAGKEVIATTKGEKETDVHLFIYNEAGKEIGKDTTTGPNCEIKFKPEKEGKYKMLVRNLGKGANKVTFEVKVAK